MATSITPAAFYNGPPGTTNQLAPHYSQEQGENQPLINANGGIGHPQQSPGPCHQQQQYFYQPQMQAQQQQPQWQWHGYQNQTQQPFHQQQQVQGADPSGQPQPQYNYSKSQPDQSYGGNIQAQNNANYGSANQQQNPNALTADAQAGQGQSGKNKNCNGCWIAAAIILPTIAVLTVAVLVCSSCCCTGQNQSITDSGGASNYSNSNFKSTKSTTGRKGKGQSTTSEQNQKLPRFEWDVPLTEAEINDYKSESAALGQSSFGYWLDKDKEKERAVLLDREMLRMLHGLIRRSAEQENWKYQFYFEESHNTHYRKPEVKKAYTKVIKSEKLIKAMYTTPIDFFLEELTREVNKVMNQKKNSDAESNNINKDEDQHGESDAQNQFKVVIQPIKLFIDEKDFEDYGSSEEYDWHGKFDRRYDQYQSVNFDLKLYNREEQYKILKIPVEDQYPNFCDEENAFWMPQDNKKLLELVKSTKVDNSNKSKSGTENKNTTDNTITNAKSKSSKNGSTNTYSTTKFSVFVCFPKNQNGLYPKGRWMQITQKLLRSSLENMFRAYSKRVLKDWLKVDSIKEMIKKYEEKTDQSDRHTTYVRRFTVTRDSDKYTKMPEYYSKAKEIQENGWMIHQVEWFLKHRDFLGWRGNLKRSEFWYALKGSLSLYLTLPMDWKKFLITQFEPDVWRIVKPKESLTETPKVKVKVKKKQQSKKQTGLSGLVKQNERNQRQMQWSFDDMKKNSRTFGKRDDHPTRDHVKAELSYADKLRKEIAEEEKAIKALKKRQLQTSIASLRLQAKMQDNRNARYQKQRRRYNQSYYY